MWGQEWLAVGVFCRGWFSRNLKKVVFTATWIRSLLAHDHCLDARDQLDTTQPWHQHGHTFYFSTLPMNTNMIIVNMQDLYLGLARLGLVPSPAPSQAWRVHDSYSRPGNARTSWTWASKRYVSVPKLRGTTNVDQSNNWHRQGTIQSSTGQYPCTWTLSHHQQITASVDGG